MREIDRLGPPGETMSRGTVFFLTRIQPREMQNDALCDGQQRNCASWPGGRKKWSPYAT